MKKIIFIVVILVAAGAIYWLAKPNFITYKEPNLAPEQKAVYEERIVAIQKVIDTFSASTTVYEQFSAYVQMGYQYQGLGEYKEAKKFYLKAIAVNPDEPNGYAALYHLQLDMEDFKGAKESITAAITLQPRLPDHWVKYLVLLESGNLEITDEELVDVYSQAFVSASPNTEIRAMFAKYWEKRGDLEKALYNWQLAQADETPNKAIYEGEAKRVQALIDAQKSQ